MTTKIELKVETYSKGILLSLNKLRENENFCDILLEVDNKTICAHKTILSAASEYFIGAFVNNRPINNEGREILRFENVSPDAMQIAIDFIYTGGVTIIEENIPSLFEVASLIQLNELQNVIEKHLIGKLDIANCLQFREQAVLFSLRELLVEVDNFILKHFDDVLQQKKFFTLDGDDLEVFLQSNLLQIKEEKTVYEVVVKWVNQDLENRRTDFERLFKCIRLQFIPIKYVTGVIRKNKLVQEFSECRDLVEDAFFYYINPEMITAETPRPSYNLCIPEPDSIMIVYPLHTYQLQFHVPKKTWTQTTTIGWQKNLLNVDCSVAVKYVNYMFCGGKDQYNQASKTVIQFNGLEWKIVASMNEARCGCAAIYYKNDLLVFGGERTWIDPKRCYYDNGKNPNCKTDFVESFEVFKENWKTLGNLTSIRSYACAEVAEDKVYLIGGFTLNKNDGHLFNYRNTYSKIPCTSTEIYDVEENKWSNGPILNIARACFGSILLNSTIYVVGGFGVGCSLLNDVEFLDTTCGVWTRVISNSLFTLSQASAYCVQGQIYLTSPDTKSMVRFDPNSFQWLQEQGNFPCNGGLIIPIWSQDNQRSARAKPLIKCLQDTTN